MRIIFVGIHNKPGLPPLDSSTKSGKLIDRVTTHISVPTIKTNLYNVDYQPPTDQLGALHLEWHATYTPILSDIIVLLGRNVQYNFPYHHLSVISIRHPSSIWGVKAQYEYVYAANILINNRITRLQYIQP